MKGHLKFSFDVFVSLGSRKSEYLQNTRSLFEIDVRKGSSRQCCKFFVGRNYIYGFWTEHLKKKDVADGRDGKDPHIHDTTGQSYYCTFY